MAEIIAQEWVVKLLTMMACVFEFNDEYDLIIAAECAFADMPSDNSNTQGILDNFSSMADSTDCGKIVIY